ncbi:MAG: hypothetical protein E6G58_04365 [Actinobacteria bacterium]|nr:MAG: hypothetical protein E6G58_04365 [Actinomycetota bacterium]
MAPSITAPDEDARRGLRLALIGYAGVPLTIVFVGLAPHGFRAGVYLAGLAAVAVVSTVGGIRARRALSAGTALRARAIAGAILGLWLGVTAAVLWFWTLVGVAL